MRSEKTPAGRPPRNNATLNHTGLLGGFDFLAADYRKQTFPRHAHEEYLVGVIEGGVHDVWCEGGWWHASRNVVATFAPDQMHHGGTGDEHGWQQTVFYFPQELVQCAMDNDGETLSFHQPFQHSEDISSRLLGLRHLLENQGETLLLQQEVLRTIELVFNRLSKVPPAPHQATPKELEWTRDYIHDNVGNSFQLDELAAVSGLTKRRFIDHFKEKFHLAPYQYVMLTRVRKAKDILKTGGSIAEAAFQAGFSDQSHLTRNFRAIYGATPARYVRQFV